MARTIEINPRIIEILRERRLPMDDALGVLVMMHHGIKPSYLPADIVSKVLAAGIAKLDPITRTFDWTYSLYDGENIAYDWVKEWMDLFKAVNPERRGTKASVVKRMKELFANNPQYNVNDVMSATRRYLQSVTNPQYCKTSHKFIKEQDGSSMLLEQLERQSTGRDARTFNTRIGL